MDIKDPKRALAVSLQSDKDHLSRIIHDITGSVPTPTEGSLAGTTHQLPLKTKYYTTTVPVWLDLIDSPSEWASSFLSPEASEVLGVLGGLLLVFSIPDGTTQTESTRQLIQNVGKVVHDGLGGWEWDGVKLAVGVGSALDVDDWDELCAEAGLEFVQVGGGDDSDKLQQFGEKAGIPRVKEALEANEWDLGSADEPHPDEEHATADGKQAADGAAALEDLENMDFGLGQTDLDVLKRALFTHQDSEQDGPDKSEQDVNDQDVAKVEAMMRRLQAAREAGETMGETQRRKMAAKAVEEVMRELY
ncbi:alpha-/gamma-adaptin-binding protein p34 [Cordyceps fumosorosea ARSEF 2679]|uniref:Alpha-/gamma-adaptin-binding protein p34 n=1 Tax=Cordyceps fumosorosea (strain ARSEF 2679) TaxID=1081104 RepID=A0A167M359_CORFA|nr:alpha-/gamma-adaptin-binding protein p34 [Cordyceps fumosorosea ARSEF 2679]OAA53857.1 alpha-/gamma-adaptin-binding protein p34 [Cordyceps fumosorosea ARSEF 2679]